MALRERNSVKTVAEHWGCSERTVRNLIKAGTLVALRLSGMIRITREQVEACEAAASTKSAQDQEQSGTKKRRDQFKLDQALRTAKRQQSRER